MKPTGRPARNLHPESIEFVPKRELDRAQQENDKLRKEIERLKQETERLRRGAGSSFACYQASGRASFTGQAESQPEATGP